MVVDPFLFGLAFELLKDMCLVRRQEKTQEEKDRREQLARRLKEQKEGIRTAFETLLPRASKLLDVERLGLEGGEKDALSRLFQDREGFLKTRLEPILSEKGDFDEDTFREALTDGISHYGLQGKLTLEKFPRLLSAIFTTTLLAAANNERLSHFLLFKCCEQLRKHLIDLSYQLIRSERNIIERMDRGLSALLREIEHLLSEARRDLKRNGISDRAYCLMIEDYRAKQTGWIEERICHQLTGNEPDLSDEFKYFPPTLRICPRMVIPADDEAARSLPELRYVQFLKSLKEGTRFLVLAGAGVGKTTFLYEVYRQLLSGDSSPEKVPVFQEASKLLENRPRDFLTQSMPTQSVQYDHNTAMSIMDFLFQSRRCVFLLDSLDQSRLDHQEVFLDQAEGYFGRNGLALCCRVEEARPQSEIFKKRFSKFQWIYLAEQTGEELQEYLGPEIGNAIKDQTSKDMLELLQVRFFARVFKVLCLRKEIDPGTMVANRSRLLEKFFYAVFHNRPIVEIMDPDKKIRSRSLLQKLSLDALCAGEKQRFTRTRLNGYRDYQDIVDLLFRSHFISYLNQNLFDHPDPDSTELTFQHQLLQEFLAARELAKMFGQKNKAPFEGKLQILAFDNVVLGLLDEMLEDHAVFDYCMDKIEAALRDAEDEKKSITDKGHFFTWILALRDRKAKRDGIRERLQEIFDEEVDRTKAEAGTDEKYVRIPAGPFLMGSYEYEDEQHVHVVYLEEYWISRYAETLGEYDEFRKGLEDQRDNPKGFYGEKRPVAYVTWDEAVRYCREFLREGYGLPTEAQWEKAARGCYGRRYPWGNAAPDRSKADYYEQSRDHTEDVDFYPQFVYGIHQMAGNVWEWTSSLWGEKWDPPDYPYPYDPGDGREDPGAPSTVLRAVRGGSFLSDAWYLRCAYRGRSNPYGGYWYIGFRVVFAPEKSSGL